MITIGAAFDFAQAPRKSTEKKVLKIRFDEWFFFAAFDFATFDFAQAPRKSTEKIVLKFRFDEWFFFTSCKNHWVYWVFDVSTVCKRCVFGVSSVGERSRTHGVEPTEPNPIHEITLI